MMSQYQPLQYSENKNTVAKKKITWKVLMQVRNQFIAKLIGLFWAIVLPIVSATLWRETRAIAFHGPSPKMTYC